jgi:serine/threonine protein phosphatase PrpC
VNCFFGSIFLLYVPHVFVASQIQDQPKSAEFITLHFDRKSAGIPPETPKQTSTPIKVNGGTAIQLVDQGAWSIKGRRQAQEDSFILHEVLNTMDRSVVLAGVFDGHLGSAAADFCRDDLPVAFAAAMNVGINGDSTPMELQNSSQDEANVQSYLELAWNQCCDSYRSSCQSTATECLAEYDPKEGILMANTGSQTAVAGTTAMVFALDQTTNQLAALNCGDSRGIVLDGDGSLLYQSFDHKPESEMERLTALGNPPRCAVSRWTVEVGQYDYAVARSLEGPLATSRGIVSDADLTLVAARAGMTVLVATDGVWDVMDTAEVQQKASKWRTANKSASDIARALCSLAYEKGSSDNMSVVVLCLE